MKKHKILTACLLIGCTIAAISMLMAAQTVKDSAKSSGSQAAAAADNSHGIICFGHVDIEGLRIGIIPQETGQPLRIADVPVKEDDTVQEGQILVKFDTQIADGEVAKAKTGVAQAEAMIDIQKAELAAAEEGVKNKQKMIEIQTAVALATKAKVEQAEIKAKETRRLSNLNLGSQADADGAVKDSEAARQAYEAERLREQVIEQTDFNIKVEKAKASIRAAQAAVDVQKELLKQAEILRDRMATITAPCAGTIQRLDCSKGQIIGMQTKMPLMVLLPKAKFIVRAEVEQEYSAKLKVGLSATMMDESDPQVAIKGKVMKVAPSFLPKRNSDSYFNAGMIEQRVLEFLIELDGEPANLRFGQKLRIKLGE